jgi:hypothetical protein
MVQLTHANPTKGTLMKPRTPEETYAPALQKASSDLLDLDPQEAAARTATSYRSSGVGSGRFRVTFLNTIYHIDWPDGSVSRTDNNQEADIATRILLLHYLLTADGSPVTGEWIAFRSLPGGLGYEAAFQGRASLRLARAFGNDKPAFEAAALALAGERLTFGDASFLFRALPSVWLAIVLHLADEEFPANANILFDASASHYLPTEDLAVLGGMLAGRMVKLGQNHRAATPPASKTP